MTSGAAIASDTKVSASPQAVACELEGNMVLLNLDSGVYFGLNGVGSDIWSYIQHGRSIEEIVDHLLVEYKVDRPRCEAEVRALVQAMAAQGLVRVDSE